MTIRRGIVRLHAQNPLLNTGCFDTSQFIWLTKVSHRWLVEWGVHVLSFSLYRNDWFPNPLIPRLLTYLGQESSQAVLIKSFHTTWWGIACLISLVLSSPVSALMVSMYVVLGLLRFGGPYWGFPKKHFWGSLFIAKKLIGLRTIRE